MVGLDGILWSGEGLMRGTYREMIDQDMIGPGFNPNKRDSKVLLKAIGGAVSGMAVRDVKPVVQEVARRSLGHIDKKVVRQLRQYSPKYNRLIAMATAPEPVVRLALHGLIDATGLSFSTTTILSSPFEIVDGRYSGNYAQLDKLSAAQGLVESSGGQPIRVGIINGMSDIEWSSEHCREVLPINPGPALSRHLELVSGQLESAIS